MGSLSLYRPPQMRSLRHRGCTCSSCCHRESRLWLSGCVSALWLCNASLLVSADIHLCVLTRTLLYMLVACRCSADKGCAAAYSQASRILVHVMAAQPWEAPLHTSMSPFAICTNAESVV